MNSMNDTGVVAGPASGQNSHTHRLRGRAGTGFIATLSAMVATTLAAALAQGLDRPRRPQRRLEAGAGDLLVRRPAREAHRRQGRLPGRAQAIEQRLPRVPSLRLPDVRRPGAAAGPLRAGDPGMTAPTRNTDGQRV